MVPVDDHDHNHDDSHDTTHDTTYIAGVPDQSEHQAYLARVADGKSSGCPIWSNDPYARAAGISRQECPDERKQLTAEVAQLKKQVSELTAAGAKANIINTTTVDNAQTPMMRSIATPISLIQDNYDVIDFNDVMNAKSVAKNAIISNGIIRRPRRSPNIDPSSEYGHIDNNNAPCLDNLGMDNRSRCNGGGGDDPGDGGSGSGRGTIGKRYGYGYGNKRTEFILVKSTTLPYLFLAVQTYMPSHTYHFARPSNA